MVTGAGFAPTAEAAGELQGVVYGGYRELARADLPIAFRERLFEMQEGAISPVIEADYGFHLFHVARRHPAETLAWQAVAEVVRKSLRSQASQRIERDMLSRASERYRVEVMGGNLPFSWDVEDRDEAGL